MVKNAAGKIYFTIYDNDAEAYITSDISANCSAIMIIDGIAHAGTGTFSHINDKDFMYSYLAAESNGDQIRCRITCSGGNYQIDSQDFQSVTAPTVAQIDAQLISSHGAGAWGAGAGGANTITVITQIGSTIAIPNVAISIYNQSGGLVASCQTDANGQTVLDVSSALYTLRPVKAGFNFSSVSWNVPTDGLTITITGIAAISSTSIFVITVLDIIKRALRLLGITATNETPDAQETADALFVLNEMMDAWQTEKLMLYAMKNEIFNITGGIGDYTIGPGADWDTARPLKIETCFVRDAVSGNLVDYNVELIPNDKYEEIRLKILATTYPTFARYLPGPFPNGTLSFWPVPNKSMSAGISQWGLIGAFVNLSDPIVLPQGYRQALAHGLAYYYASEFGLNPAKFQTQMIEAKANIKRINTEVVLAGTDASLRSNPSHIFNIYAGL
jgi:hypothetical protein